MRRFDIRTSPTVAPLLLVFFTDVTRVQLWVVAVAFIAGVLTSLTYLLRCRLGLVKPVPPSEQEEHPIDSQASTH